MSRDESVTNDLVQTLEDGETGFTRAAERLEDSDRADLAQTFREFAAQRQAFSAELRSMAQAYGDHVDDDGTVVAALHRGWMAIKDALSGSDATGVLTAAEQGEDHAVAEYEKALAHDDVSAPLRAVIERQYAHVKAAHDAVKAMRDEVVA